jgi:GAF domain-containing protein
VFEILPIPAWVQVVITTGVVVIIAFLTALILDSRDVRYESSLAAAEVYAAEVDVHRVSLEERGSALERRARYLETTAEVAREVTSVLDVPELLARVVTLISERFGFYHIGLFLLDPGGEWAVLQAASSVGGQQMLARGHRLKIGEVGIVSYVIGQGERRIASDVGTDAVFFNNPDLPETRSEMALPLWARGEVIGALDVQSREPAAFTEEDAAVLQTLADQVAMAIGNARLFEQAQQSLEAERRAYGELSGQAWVEVLRARPGLGYRYEKGRVVLPVEHPMPHSERRRENSERPSESTEALPELTLPVQVREHTIGTVNAHKPGGAGSWTSEEVELMKTLTEQLSVALESARLYQDTQRRAAQERVIGEVTARMRESLDIEKVLQTATEELYQVLGLRDLAISLTMAEPVGAVHPGNDSNL